MDLSGIFFMATVCSILGAVFSYLFIPETRNKSISELQNLFQQKHNVKRKGAEKI